MVNHNHIGHILNQKKKDKMKKKIPFTVDNDGNEKYTMKHLNAPKTTPPGFFLDKNFIWKAIDYDPLRDNVSDEDRFARLGVNGWDDWNNKKYKYFGIWMKEWLSVQGKEWHFEKCTVTEIDDWLYYTYWTQKNRGPTVFCQKQAFIEEWLYENNHDISRVDLRQKMLKKVREVDKRYDLTQIEYNVPEKM